MIMIKSVTIETNPKILTGVKLINIEIDEILHYFL